MDSASDIEDLVTELHSCAPLERDDGNDRRNKVLKAKEIAEDIKNFVAKSKHDPSQISSLLDNKDDLTSFLIKSTKVKKADYSEANQHILKALQHLLIKFEKLLESYLLKIRNVSGMFVSAKEAKVRQHAYSTLGEVVSTAAQSENPNIAEDLHLSQLFDQLFKVLAGPADKSEKAKQCFLSLLGKLARHFPDVVQSKATRLVTHLVKEMDSNATKFGGKDDVSVGGSVQALSGFVTSFQYNELVLSPAQMGKIHNHLLMLIERGQSTKTRQTPRVALEFLAEHSSHFGQGLLANYDKWFEALQWYALLPNPDDYRPGVKALVRFMEEIARQLHADPQPPDKLAITSYFVTKARDIMNSDLESSKYKLKNAAVKALGDLSASMNEHDVDFLFQFLLNKTSYICQQEDSKIVALLSSHLEAVGLVVSRLTRPFRLEETRQLQKVCVVLFARYLDIAGNKRFRCGRSVAIFFLGTSLVLRNPLDYTEFVADVVTQGLIRSARPELGLDPTKNEPKTYSFLWSDILNFARLTDLPFSLEVQVRVSKLLDEHLIKAVSAIIRRLDFTTEDSLAGTTEAPSEETSRQPTGNPADRQMCTNLIDILEDLLPKLEPKERVEPWLGPLGIEAIDISLKFPKVPGLYRLVSVILRVTGEELSYDYRPHYQYYVSSVIDGMAQLSDDLLFSAVKVVLFSPSWMVSNLAGSVSSVLASALKLGLTNPGMARWPLDALDHWQSTLPASAVMSIMEDLLPYLEPYLRSVELVKKELPVIIGAGRPKTPFVQKDEEMWRTSQRRVVKLLGRMGPGCSRLVDTTEDDVVIGSAAGWQSGRHLDYRMPLNDLNPVVHLESFLPRILHLVQQSGDLKLRLSACEFLHAVTIYLTGRHSQDIEERQRRKPLTLIYSKIFPVVLRLAVDLDDLVRQLFENLLLQLVHWFSRPAFQQKDATGKRSFLNAETALLVETLTDSTCLGDESSQVRERAAQGLSEFLIWNVKHSTDATLWADPAGPDFLFQKVRALATHPSPQQRLGAAVICNHLHHVLRESEPLSSIFTLDLLAHFVVSLSLAERDPVSLGTVQQCKLVLHNLGRIVQRRREMFEVNDSRRRAAPFFVQATYAELLDLLLKHSFGVQRHCRRACLELCRHLCHPKSFAESTRQYLQTRPLVDHLPVGFPARLDVYRWLLRYDVIDESVCNADSLFQEHFQSFLALVTGEPNPNVVLFWLEFLKEYLKKLKNADNPFISVELLMRAVLFPSSLGFPAHLNDLRHKLRSQLADVLAFANQEQRGVIQSKALEHKIDQGDVKERRDLLSGLILLAKAKCINRCSVAPTALLSMAIEEFDIDAELSGLMVELALSIGLQMDRLVTEFKNPTKIVESDVTAGQNLRSRMGSLVFPIIGRCLDSIEPFLPQKEDEDGQQWALLLEIVQAVQDTEKKSWAVQALLARWDVLESHAESCHQSAKLLMLVDHLIRLDAGRVGEKLSVLRWIIRKLNTADLALARELIPLLRILAGAKTTEAEEAELTSALERMFALFPSKTTGMNDAEKSDYYSVLNPLIALCRIPIILRFLQGVFAMEPKHPSAAVFTSTASKWMSTCTSSDVAVDQALSRAYQNATALTINAIVRMDGVENVYVPLLRAAPSAHLERHIQSLLPDLIPLTETLIGGMESLTKKAVLCCIVATAVMRLGAAAFKTHLNATFCSLKDMRPSDDGKDLLRYITKFVVSNIQKIPKESIAKSDLEVFQRLQGYAFNLIQSIAFVSSPPEAAVDMLIFKPLMPNLWDSIVGTTQEYSLPVEVDRQRIKRFKVFIASGEASSVPTGYMASQDLCASSLSEDINRFDFNQMSLATYHGTQRSYDLPPLEENAGTTFYLEMNELNEHRCMGPLMHFIQELDERSRAVRGGSTPNWMHSLRSALLEPSFHRNVSLFIIRLVINMKSVFQPYAQFWYRAFLTSLLRKIGGEPLNNLFREGIETVLEWCKSDPLPIDDQDVIRCTSGIVRLIVKEMKHVKSEVTTDNMEMFKAVIAMWEKVPMEMPYDLVLGFLVKGFSDQRLGLQMLEVLVFHGFLPNNHPHSGQIKKRMIELLCQEDRREISRACSRVCGAILSQESEPSEFQLRVTEAFSKWHTKGKDDVFIDLLYSMSQTCPSFLSAFVRSNLLLLKNLYGTLKVRCLEVLAASWMHLEDPWREVGKDTIESILKGTSPAELCPVLSVLKELIRRLDVHQWKPLWPTLLRLERHRNVAVRSHLHELFQIAYDCDSSDPDFAQALLRSCTDDDQDLAVKMQNFLAEKLPADTPDRLLAYVENFYSPGSMNNFLPFCSHFILERATHSHLFRQPVFEQPLDDIPFEVMELSTPGSQSMSHRGTWTTSPRKMRPQTLQHGMLRQTLSSSQAAFPVTQGAASWLMTETQEACKDLPGLTTLSLLDSSAGTETKDSEGFAVPYLPPSTWKRFAGTSSLAPERKSYANRRSVEAAGKPVVYRRYRRGDLPDIQIPHSSLIIPLQAVALNDPSMAKTLFCVLLTSIRRQVKEIRGDDTEYSAKLNAALGLILGDKRERDSSASSLLSAVMEYLWLNQADDLNFDSRAVADVCKANHLLQLGILFLEASLPRSSSEPQAKRARREVLSSSQRDWFCVASLYGDLEDIDSLRAVIRRLSDCHESTRKAIECESQSDWNRAAQLYSQVLKHPPANVAETEFCGEYHLKCLEQLGRWEEIGRLGPTAEPWNTRAAFHHFVDNSFRMDSKTKQLDQLSLSSAHPAVLPQLAAFAFRNGNKDRAQLCINRATDEFLSRYSRLSSLNFGGRKSILQQLCTITEVQSFLENVDWERLSAPQKDDSVLVWNTVLPIRSCCIQSEDVEPLVALEQLNSLRLQLADVALDQHNVHLAQKMIDDSFNVSSALMPLRQIARCKVLALESTDDPLFKLDQLIQAKEILDPVAAEESFSDGLMAEVLNADLCAQVYNIINNLQPREIDGKRRRLNEVWGVTIDRPKELIVRGLNHLKRCTEGDSTAGRDIGKTYYTLSRYCHQWRDVLKDANELSRSVLRSMRYGSCDGQSLFPLVIMALKEKRTTDFDFERERAAVPLNMFLPWVNQLVSNTASTPALTELLVDMARTYATHVRVPFEITRKTFGPNVLHFKRIESELPTDPTWELFQNSISYLQPPGKFACDMLSSSKEKLSEEEIAGFKSKFLNLQPPSVDSAYGRVHYAFSVAFTAMLEKVFENPSDSSRWDDVKAKIFNHWKKLRLDKSSLRDFSPWLANYKSSDYNSDSVLRLPIPSGKLYTIEAFRDDIQFLQSLRFPVKLTIVVDGAVEYPVLVKHGEDVRQDERISQLLRSMDLALRRDRESRKRRLRIHSFQVIPLTSTCGLFEWVGDTVTLKSFLENDESFNLTLRLVETEKRKMFRNPVAYYFNTPQEQLTQDYVKLVNMVPATRLQDALKQLSTSPEAFFYLRGRMAASLGAQNAAHWVLGIGDRHLSNTLVSIKTGDVIGIDFGIAFGLGARVLAIPELVPFRLTPQILHLIPGLGATGPIRESMIHTLRVVREESGSIMAALSIFATEPTLDWVKRAKGPAKAAEQTAPFSESSLKWSPEEVVRRTESALNGAHPAEITCADLEGNEVFQQTGGAKLLSQLKSVVRGDAVASEEAISSVSLKRKPHDGPYRAAIPPSSLSVEQQVDCLIDQASDIGCLSRMYFGWEPWI